MQKEILPIDSISDKDNPFNHATTVKERTPDEIKAAVKQMLLLTGIKDGEGLYRRWFEESVFTNNSVAFPNKFLANNAKKYSRILVSAFGFMPDLVVQQQKENPGAVAPVVVPEKRAKVIPIKRVQMPKTGFAAKEMVLLNLPHSDPKAHVWTRENGHLTLLIQGGYRKKTKREPEYMGIPYGTKARLILFWLMSEAMRTKSKKIYLGDSYNAFLAAIGIEKDRGGKESGREAVTKQLHRILHASFMVQCNYGDDEKTMEAGTPVRFTGKYELWMGKKDPNRMELFSSFVELSQEFFDSLKKAPVPLDWEIIVKIGSGRKASSLSLDLYAWLSYESAKAQHKGKGRFVPWAALKAQMGATYKRSDNFVIAVKKAIAEIKKEYNRIKVSFPRGGIKIEDDSLPSCSKADVGEKKR
jgi:hypothetical protein